MTTGKRLELPITKSITSITSTKDRLYVVAIDSKFIAEEALEGQRGWWIFRSTDLGNSWKNITPTHVWKALEGWRTNIRLVAAGETLMAIEKGMVRSTDGGDTWMPLQAHSITPSMFSNFPIATLSKDIFYFGSWDYGLQRSTDGGKSWDIVKVIQDGSGISNLIVFKETNNEKTYLPLFMEISEIW